MFKNIVPQSSNNEREILTAKALFLRKCNRKVFSLQVIADALGKSKTTIQKIIKEADET